MISKSVSITIRPGCAQVEVHCHWRNDRTVDWCKQEGIHVTAYAPLSSPQTMRKEGKDVPNLLKVLYLFSQLQLSKVATCLCLAAKLNLLAFSQTKQTSVFRQVCSSVLLVHVVPVTLLMYPTHHM